MRLENVKKAPFPRDVKPMLATLVDQPFDNPDWVYEVKWDGYRVISYLNRGRVEMRSRNNLSFNVKKDDRIRYSDHVVGKGIEFLSSAVRHGLEGVMLQNRAIQTLAAPYAKSMQVLLPKKKY